MDSLSEIASACTSGIVSRKGEKYQQQSWKVLGVLTKRIVIDRQGKLLELDKER